MVRGLPPYGRSLHPRADPFEGRDPLAGRRFQPLAQRFGVVGDQLRPMPGAADLDVEALLRGRVRVVRFHDGNHVVDRASLERMHRGRPSM